MILTTICHGLYNQYSIYSGAKLSLSNFECPPFDFFTTAWASHYYTFMYALYRALRHSCRSIGIQVKFSVPHVQLLIVIHSSNRPSTIIQLHIDGNPSKSRISKMHNVQETQKTVSLLNK